MSAPQKVVVCIPAYNEQSTIRGVVEQVRSLGYDVLVVDDGSTDATSWEAEMGDAHVIRYPQNLGVGESLTWGTLYAREYLKADIIVTMDADGQHDPSYIPTLVAALDGCDLVNGSRFLGTYINMPWHRRLVLWFVYVAFWIVSGREITDPCCGMKAFRPEVFKIRSKRMAWACELFYNVSRHGKVREVPVTVRYSRASLLKGQRSSNIFRAGLELFRALRES